MKKPGKKEIRVALEEAMMIAVARMNFKPSKKSIKAISKSAKEAARFLKDDLGSKSRVKDKPKGKPSEKVDAVVGRRPKKAE